MDKDGFIAKMESLTPPESIFESMGVSSSFMKSTIERYQAVKRNNIGTAIFSGDEIIQMLQLYDCSKLRVGHLTFLKEVREFQDYFQIGKVEIDPLVLNKVTNEIEVRDHDVPNHVIWPCAENSRSFLDALIVCAEYLRGLLTNNSLGNNRRYLLSVVETCTEKAGGEHYIEFYKMLLAYW